MRELRKKRTTWQWLSIAILSLWVFSIPAFGGQLDPSAVPAPTMKTPDQIPPTWDQVLPASGRFKLVMGNAAVLDKETGLVWKQSPSTGVYTWDHSGSNAQESCNDKTIFGRKGWRLPALQELASLVDPSVPGIPKLPSGHPFNYVQSDYYWSATDSTISPSHAWDVTFYGGYVGDVDKGFSKYVWCVRGGSGPYTQ